VRGGRNGADDRGGSGAPGETPLSRAPKKKTPRLARSREQSARRKSCGGEGKAAEVGGRRAQRRRRRRRKTRSVAGLKRRSRRRGSKRMHAPSPISGGAGRGRLARLQQLDELGRKGGKSDEQGLTREARWRGASGVADSRRDAKPVRQGARACTQAHAPRLPSSRARTHLLLRELGIVGTAERHRVEKQRVRWVAQLQRHGRDSASSSR
jgi:hypothetical protein